MRHLNPSAPALFVAILSVNCLAIAQDAEYVEIDRLRRSVVKAQQEWHGTYPNLESYLLTRPKAEVLGELTEAERAGRQFTTLQRQYFERRAQEFSRQREMFRSLRSPIDSKTHGSQIQNMLDVQMKGVLADQQILRARLDEVSAAVDKNTPEQILVRRRLELDLSDAKDLYIKLAEQKERLAKTIVGDSDVAGARGRLLEIQSQLQQNAEAQILLAIEEDTRLASYYRKLRAAVESRPDDPPVVPSSGVGLPPKVTSSGTSGSQPGVPGRVTPYFRGTWVLPDRGQPYEAEGCWLRSAEGEIFVEDQKHISGYLVFRFAIGDPSCRSRVAFERNEPPSPELKIDFAGSAKGRQADLASANKGRRKEIGKTSGKVVFELSEIEEHSARVTWKIEIGTSFVSSGSQIFSRKPESVRPVGGTRDAPTGQQRTERPTGWKLADPKKPDDRK